MTSPGTAANSDAAANLNSSYSSAYKNYALGSLTLVYLVNFLDRGLMGLLLEPIKKDLNLSDTQLGFLTGIAFAIFYATLGIPIARWADRGNRATIASVAIALWGGAMMLCLFVTNFVQLVAARVAAAVGEAGGMPPTYSLVGDYFPKANERSKAMTVYLLGGPASSVLGFMLGGWLNEQVGWRMTFFLMGIPGLLIALLVKLTVKDPRTARKQAHGITPPKLKMADALRMLFYQSTSRELMIGIVLLWTLGLGLAPWYAAFLMRTHGLGTAELGIWLGFVFGVGGIVGLLSGGILTTRFFPANESGQLRLSAIVMAGLLPCYTAFLLVPAPWMAITALLIVVTVYSFFLGPTLALLQRLANDGARATNFAVIMLIANLVGMGLGPQLVGVASDLFEPSFGKDSLRYAMLIMSVTSIWAAHHFWRASRSVASDLVEIEDANHAFSAA